MKNLLLIMALFSGAVEAYPKLTITAPVTELAAGQTTVVTFTFKDSETNEAAPVTGFTLSDANIQGDAVWTTGLSGSGSTYTATLQKLVTRNTVSVVVDNKSYAAVTGGELGSYASIGFNTSPTIYVKEGGLFAGKFVEAEPQPRCPLPGEYLVDAAGNPSSPAIEDFYVLSNSNRQVMTYELLPYSCLTRLVAGQRYKAKVSPPSYEAINVQGGHKHTTLMPKATTQFIQPKVGTTRPRVMPANINNNPVNGSGILQDTGRTYNNINVMDFGGDSRFSNKATKFSNDDPILYPGVRGAAHLHTFFGNNGVNHQTNNANLQTNCVSLIAGGSVNCTGYWMPTVIDTATNTALMPRDILIYYKHGSGSGTELAEPLPQGLKIIIGNPAAASEAEQFDDVRFECFRRDGVQELPKKSFSSCDSKTYGEIWLSVNFPHCVADDGTGKMKLDSPDHRSHLNIGGIDPPTNAAGCPLNFPHSIPSISQIAMYDILPGQNTATWRLSSDNYSSSLPGGYSLHADWWGGWKNYWAQRMVDQCVNKAFNCGTGYIGLHDGIGISSITTVGNIATITTAIPHKLRISNPDGDYPYLIGGGTALYGYISGITGTDAAAYNGDLNKNSYRDINGVSIMAPHGVQALKIINENTIEYTLNYTPSNTTVNVTNAKIQWGEFLCGLEDGRCDLTGYSDYYYGDKE